MESDPPAGLLALLTPAAAAAPPSVQSKPDPDAEFARISEKVYRAVNAKDWSAMRSNLSSLPHGRCSGDPREVPVIAKAKWVSGGRAVVHVGKSGSIESHTIVGGCVIHADPSLVIRAGEGLHVDFVGRQRTFPEWPVPEEKGTSISSDWVVLESQGNYIAIRRRDGEILQGSGFSNERSYAGDDLGALATGDTFVHQDQAGTWLTRASGETVKVRGCAGVVGSAVAFAGQTILHVMPSNRREHPHSDEEDGEPEDRGPNSFLCYVARNGLTLRTVNLGSGICGMKEASKCPWIDMKLINGILSFNSVRQGYRVWAATGATARLSEAAWNEETRREQTARDRAWCVEKDLPLPPEACRKAFEQE